MDIDTLVVVDVGDVSNIDQGSSGVTLTFLGTGRVCRVCFLHAATFLRFQEQAQAVADDLTRQLRARTVDSLRARKDGFTSRHCKACQLCVDAPVDAQYCHHCGEEFPIPKPCKEGSNEQGRSG